MPSASAVPPAPKDLKLVYGEEGECMEEKREQLAKYRYDEAITFASA